MKKIDAALVALCPFGFGKPGLAQNSIPASSSNTTGSGGLRAIPWDRSFTINTLILQVTSLH